MKWVRARDGMIFGVCKGLARSLDIPVGWFRLIWIASLIFLGAGFWLYLMMAVSLPREDKQVEALDPWLLGVCARISMRTDVEVGVVRFLTICLSLISLGATIVGYVILYFIIDDKPRAHARSQSSDSKPAAPPAMM